MTRTLTPRAERRRAGRVTPEPAAESPATPPPAAPGYVMLSHDEIRPDPDNARKAFDIPDLAILAETLFTRGILQAPIVSLVDGGYQLVAGERRWRAWGILVESGRWAESHVEPCRLETADERQRMEAALIENLQRVDLNHMEAGLAFETRGKRHHVSNKDMAARIGRTAEYVQQHRRLAALEPEDQQRLREGRLSMHDALRIVNTPKPADLTPAQMLLLAEIAHKAVREPLKGYNYHGGRTECAFDAPDKSGALKALIDRQVVQFTAREYDIQRAVIQFHFRAGQFDEALAPVRAKGKAGDEALAAFREAAGSNSLAASGPYVAPWLNGPFPLHPDAEKELAKRATDKAKLEAAQKAAKAKAEEVLAELDAMTASIVSLLPAERAAAIATKLHFSGTRGPFAFEAGQYSAEIKDANGRKLAGVHWECKDQALVGRLLALALNLVWELGADGLPAEPPPALAAEEPLPELDGIDDPEDELAEAEPA